ncbi:MAG: site-specific integrase, partial [Gemmatimonadota bacterium]
MAASPPAVSGMREESIARAFLLERFDEFLTLEQGSSARTNEAYGRDVARLAVWASTRGVGAPSALTAPHHPELVYHQKDVGLAPSSMRRAFSAIRTWYVFLLAEGVVAAYPSDRLETPRKWRT